MRVANFEFETRPGLPAIGCVTWMLAMFLMCLIPLFLVDVVLAGLERLHLSPGVAVLALVSIVAGGLINIPVRRLSRSEEQIVDLAALFGVWGRPMFRRVRRDTVVAVNFGGCVVPSMLAIWEASHVLHEGARGIIALLLVSGANIVACYRVARPIQGVGIAMPGFVSPLVSVGLTWLLLWPGHLAALRPPVAFVAGVVGPLVGADLLHLKDITRVSAGVLSIGGAGTFDGIVLSGMVAALLA